MLAFQIAKVKVLKQKTANSSLLCHWLSSQLHKVLVKNLQKLSA